MNDSRLTFVFHAWKETARLAARLPRLRSLYPDSRILLISDGDPDPLLPELATKHSADFLSGNRLKRSFHGGKWWIRMIEEFLKGPQDILIKIDSDSVMHRRFIEWPDDSVEFFGQMFRFPRVERIRAVGGFCKGIRRHAAIRMLESGLFSDPLYTTHPAARYKGNILCEDFMSSHVAHRLGIVMGDWSEVRNLGGSNKPIPRHTHLAVTHPHKMEDPVPDVTPAPPRIGALRKIKGNSRWSISDAEKTLITKYCLTHNIKSALEFGPGKSTEALIAAGVDPIYSYEDHPLLIDEYRNRFRDSEQVTIIHYSESKDLALGDAPVPFENVLDLAVVDGPVGKLYKEFSRINTMLFASQHADRIIIHDCTRSNEQNSIRVMEELGWVCHKLSRNVSVLLKTHSL